MELYLLGKNLQLYSKQVLLGKKARRDRAYRDIPRWLQAWIPAIGPRGLGLPTVMRDDTVSAAAWKATG